MPRPNMVRTADGSTCRVTRYAVSTALLTLCWLPLSLWFGYATAAWVQAPPTRYATYVAESDPTLQHAGFCFAWGALVSGSLLFTWHCNRCRRPRRRRRFFITAFAVSWLGTLLLLYASGRGATTFAMF